MVSKKKPTVTLDGATGKITDGPATAESHVGFTPSPPVEAIPPIDEFVDETMAAEDSPLSVEDVPSVALPPSMLEAATAARKDVRVFLKFDRPGTKYEIYGVRFLPTTAMKDGKEVKVTPLAECVLSKDGRGYPAKFCVFQALKTGMENEARRLHKNVSDVYFVVEYMGQKVSNSTDPTRHGKLFKSFVPKGY